MEDGKYRTFIDLNGVLFLDQGVYREIQDVRICPAEQCWKGGFRQLITDGENQLHGTVL